MPRVIALTALTALGLSGEPFHEPFHGERLHLLLVATVRDVSEFIIWFAEGAQVVGELTGGGQSPGVLRAQDPATAVQSVLGQVAGDPHLAQRAQVGSELSGGVQGVGVVRAQDSATAVQRVLVQFTGGLYLPQPVQVVGEVVRGMQGAGMVLTA
jgi:hypothetical protein